MKKKYIITAIAVALFFSLAVPAYFILQKPSVRFLLHMSELTTPDDYVTEERTYDLGDRTLGVMIYRHKNVKSNKYYMVVHGLTPQEYNHPAMHLLASALCDSTGMNVLKPYVSMEIKQNHQPVAASVNNIAIAYKTLYQKNPGDYRALGGCIGGTSLLIALESVPREIYPKKILLLGPVFNGSALMNYYNMAGINVDFVVKLAVSLTSDLFTDDEKNLIRTAFNAAKPGDTDKSEMKKILGTGLYNDLLMFKLHNKEFEQINLQKILHNNKSFPDCEFFILHTKKDRIVPKTQGEALYNFMKKIGYNANFIGTEIFDHTENKVTVSGFLKEMKYLVGFFDELFKGDNELQKNCK